MLGNTRGLEIDVHVIECNDKGDGIFGLADAGEVYPAAALTGQGRIGNLEVHCISSEFVLKFHQGYTLTEKDRMDVLAICDAFDLPIPEAFA